MNDDLIRRGKIGNDIALYMAENAYLNDTALDVLKMIAKWVDEQPAVDAVEVVRCLYCIHAEMDDPDFPDQYYCHAGCGWNKADFFCAYGERREDDAHLE